MCPCASTFAGNAHVRTYVHEPGLVKYMRAHKFRKGHAQPADRRRKNFKESRHRRTYSFGGYTESERTRAAKLRKMEGIVARLITGEEINATDIYPYTDRDR